MATATVAASTLVVSAAVAQGLPEYHYDGKLWSAGPTYKTPSVGGHPLAKQTIASPKTVKPLRTYRPSRPAWPSAGSSTVVLSRGTQLSATTAGTKGKSTAQRAASPARVGNLPVWVAPARQAAEKKGTSASAPSAVRVQLAGHAQAQAAGVDGMLVGFARGDGAASSGRVAVTLDYSALDKAYGGGWASRLHLVSVPGCVLTTPQKPACRVRTPLASTNNPVAKNLTATLDLPRATSSSKGGAGIHADVASGSTSMAPMTAVEAISGTSGSQGDYTATSLNPSGSWSANGTGAFTYSYPIAVPHSLGGPAPSVAFAYDSQSEDGETSARNSQSSWLGDGWSYSPGFIERSYKPCKQDGISDSADFCWGGWLATLSLGGHSGTLVRDDSSNSATPTATQTWHLQGDDGTKIEELGGADNGLWNGEYFKVTTTDGTAYYFGLNHAPGTTSDTATNSAWGEPVYSPKSGDPCYDSGQGKDSQCTMGYRFNLDFAVDPHTNVQRYTYAEETNYYDRGGGQVAASGGSGTLTKYVRGGYLTEIDYGYQLADEAAGSKPGARVQFNTAQRCQTSSTFTDCSFANLNDKTATNWPDVPYDLNCASTDVTSGTGSNVCLTTAPSFWSTDRLDSVVTQVNVGGTLTNVDTYQLNQTYSDAGGTVDPVTGQSGQDSADAGELQSVMWLSSVQHTGDDTTGGGSSAITQPKVSFLGTEIDNRVDGGNEPSLFHPRISSITTESGESIAVTYSDPDCSRLNKTMPSSPDADTMSCYNVYWTIPGGVTPVSDWFNKTRVKTVDVSDTTGTGSPMQVTNYTYSGPAWHRDDSELTDDTYRTWDQFRGYRTVTVTTGASPDPITQKTTTYLQGMDGDVLADGSKRSVSVTDTVGDTVTDNDWLSGTPLEADTYTQAGGSVDAKQIDLPQSFTTTATHSSGSSLPAVIARMIKTSQQRTYGLLTTGSWRETEKDTSYNGDALPATVDAKGDVSVASQEKCATTSYATPPSGNPMMRSYPDEILAVASPCGTTPGTSTTISDKLLFYDGDGTVANPGTFGHLSTTGDLTATQVITGYSSGTPAYRTTQATAYDTYGRATQVQDAAKQHHQDHLHPHHRATPDPGRHHQPAGLVHDLGHGPAARPDHGQHGPQRPHHHHRLRRTRTPHRDVAAGTLDVTKRQQNLLLCRQRHGTRHGHHQHPARRQHLQHRDRHLRRHAPAAPDAVHHSQQPGRAADLRHLLRQPRLGAEDQQPLLREQHLPDDHHVGRRRHPGALAAGHRPRRSGTHDRDPAVVHGCAAVAVHHRVPGRRPHRHHPGRRWHGDLVLHQRHRPDHRNLGVQRHGHSDRQGIRRGGHQLHLHTRRSGRHDERQRGQQLELQLRPAGPGDQANRPRHRHHDVRQVRRSRQPAAEHRRARPDPLVHLRRPGP
ncbi:hypothetical protein ACQ4WX_35400 [Streptomyces lasalocidi]